MSRRELVVSGPAGDARVFEQMEALRGDPVGAAERELEVLEREGDAFQVELLGKDRRVKARWEDVVDVGELWARIDAMPSRRRELKEQAAGGQTTRPLYV